MTRPPLETIAKIGNLLDDATAVAATGLQELEPDYHQCKHMLSNLTEESEPSSRPPSQQSSLSRARTEAQTIERPEARLGSRKDDDNGRLIITPESSPKLGPVHDSLSEDRAMVEKPEGAPVQKHKTPEKQKVTFVENSDTASVEKELNLADLSANEWEKGESWTEKGDYRPYVENRT